MRSFAALVGIRKRRAGPLAVLACVSAGLFVGCGGELPSDDPVANGQWLAERWCVSCHGPEDTALGPTLVRGVGEEVELVGGKTVVRDAEYYERAISDPWLELVAGYGRTMLRQQWRDEEIEALLAWLQAGAPMP